MASKKDIHEVDLTDFDDEFGDLFGNEDNKPLTRIEKAKRAAKGAKLGFIDALTSRKFILTTLNRAIPSEYGIDTRVIDDTLSSIDELTYAAGKEAAKVNDSLKTAAKPFVDKYENKLPKRIREAVKEYVADKPSYGGLSQVSEEDSFVSSKLEELFATQSARAELRDEERRAKETIYAEIEHQDRKKNLMLTDSIRSSLERMANFQDKVTANFQRKSLEIGLRQYFVQGRLLEITKENAEVTQENLKSLYDAVNTPDIIKLREHKDTKRLYGGSRGEKGLFGNVTGIADRIRENAQKRTRDAIQSAGMGLTMALGFMPNPSDDDGFGFGDKYTEKGRSIGGMVAPSIGALVGNQIRKRLQRNKRAQGIGRQTAFLTQNFRNLLEEEALSNDIEYDDRGREKFSAKRSISRLLHGLVSDERGSGVLQTDSLETLQAAHPFTKQTNRTINEVIPGLLGMIHQSVEGLRTGELPSAMSFDYVKGRFVSEKTAAKRTIDNLLLRGQADVVQTDVNDLLDEIDKEGSLNRDERLDLATFLMRQSHDKRLGSKGRLTDIDTFSQFSPEQAQKFQSAFSQYFDSEDPDLENNFTRRYNNLMNQSGLTRDDFHALLNTGQIRHLEDVGLVKDGKIDYDQVFRMYMTHDYENAESDILDNTRTARHERLQEEAKRLADAERVSGFIGAGKERFQQSRLGQSFMRGKSAISDKFSSFSFGKVSRRALGPAILAIRQMKGPITRERIQELLAQKQAEAESQGALNEADTVSMDEAIDRLMEETQSTPSSVHEDIQGVNNKIAEVTGVYRDGEVDPAVDPGSEHVAEEFRTVGDSLGDKISQILDKITEKFDYDKKQDEGPRRGSYADIMSRRGDKKKEIVRNDGKAHDEKESGFGMLSGLMGLLGKLPGLGPLLGMLGGLGGGALGMGGSLLTGALGLGAKGLGAGARGLGSLLGKVPGMGGFAAGGVNPIASAGKSAGFLGKMARGAGTVGRLGLKGAGLLGRGAMGLAGILSAPNPLVAAGKTLGGIGTIAKGAGKLAWTGAKLAAPVAKWGLMKALPFVFNPATLAIGDAALAGYGAYKFFTRAKLTELNRIRLTQYGYGPEDLDKLKQMLRLEEIVRDTLTLNREGIPKINHQKLDAKAIVEALEIDMEDQEAILRLQDWVQARFLPVYLAHVGVLNRLLGKTNLEDIEDLKKDQILEYVKGVKLDHINYEGGSDPKTGEPLEGTSSVVEAAWEKARDYALTKVDKRSKAGKGATPTGDASGEAALAETPENQKTEGEATQPESRGFWDKVGAVAKTAVSITPFGLAAKIGERFAKGVKDLVVGKVENARQALTEIGALDAIRFKLYGLNEMSADKIATLLSLENFMTEEIEFDSTGQATWEGSIDAVVHEFSSRFGVIADTPEAQYLREWLTYRFLPVFTRGMSFLYTRVKATKMSEGLNRIRGVDRLEMAYELLATMTLMDTDTVSVWRITVSPWPDYVINGDLDSIKENLAILKNDAKNHVIPEKKLPESSVSPTGALNQPAHGSNLGVYGGTGSNNFNPAGLMTVGPQSASGQLANYRDAQGNLIPGALGGSFDSQVGAVSFNTGTGGLADQLPDPQGDGSYAAYKDMIAEAARMTGVDPTLLASLIAIESGFRGSVKAKTSSATGLGQFIKATWAAMLKKYGSKYGIPQGTDPKNPKANVLMTAEYINENAAYLKKNTSKQALTPVDLYMAHFLGPAGYAKFLNAGPDALGAAVNPAAAKANASIFYRDGRAQTTSQIVRHFENTLIRRAKSFGVDMGGGGTPAAPTQTPTGNENPQATGELPPGVTASSAVAVANAEDQAVAQPTAAPGSSEVSNELSLTQLGSSYMGPTSTASTNVTPQTSTGTQPSSEASSVANSLMNFSPLNERTAKEAQELSLQQTAGNDTASKLIGTTNDILNQQLEVQVGMRDVLLKMGDVVADIATALNEKVTASKDSGKGANGTVPKGTSVTRNLERSHSPFPKPAIPMRRNT